MKIANTSITLGWMALGLLFLSGEAQAQFTPLAPSPSLGGAVRPDLVIVVDAAGAGDFTVLQEGIDAAPDGALVLVHPGDYLGATLSGRSLRLMSSTPGAARLRERLEVTSLAAAQEVHVGGFAFSEGFLVDGCQGKVSLAGCSSIDNDVLILPPPGVTFGFFPACGIGLSRHEVHTSTAVSLVDCDLTGRNGLFSPSACDGVPGEHGLLVVHSRVTLYGTDLAGGHGSDGPGCHGGHAGAGGDGALVRGASSRLLHCGGLQTGGTGGRDLELDYFHGCTGEGFRAFDGALVEPCALDSIDFHIAPLSTQGVAPFYEITGPPGADVFMMIAPRRGWREFPASVGVLHLGGPLTIVPLGAIPPSGFYSRPLPAPTPHWHRAYASVELQVYGLVAGQDRYSEARTLQVTYPGL